MTTVATRPRGVAVEVCEKNSPAWKAGIRVGDRIIAIDGNETADVIDVNFHAAVEEFEVTFLRNDSIEETVVERPYGKAHGMMLEDPPIRECVNFCPFCFVDQGPKSLKMRKGLEIKDDDYRYSFLYGHYVTLTNLSRKDLERIKAMRLSPLYVSVHATDPEVRAKALGRPKADPMPLLRQLAECSIELHTQIVMMRDVNDGAIMQRTVKDLFTLHPEVKTVAIVPVGLTSHHSNGVDRWDRSSARSALDEVMALGREYPEGFVQAADEWFSMLGEDPPVADYYGGMAVEENGVGMVRKMLDEWSRFKFPKRISKRSALVITGKSPELFIRRMVDRMASIDGADIELVAAVNRTYGPDTTVTGLLAWRDIAPIIAASSKKDIFIPDVMVDGRDRFLDDITIAEARTESGRSIHLTETSARGLYSIIA